MKRLKKIMRMCALILFMVLAATGIGLLGIAPTLTKDRKLFADIEAKADDKEQESKNIDQETLFKN